MTAIILIAMLALLLSSSTAALLAPAARSSADGMHGWDVAPHIGNLEIP
jgi:hypothetical protein